MGACFSSASAAPAGAADERRPSKEDYGKRRRRAAGTSPEGAAAPAAAPVRVEFGYERDFEARYEVGRLLGHGQFGYTFAATDRGSGDRVAVKRIDKAKVSCRLPLPPPSRRAVSVSPRSSSLEVAIPSVPLVHRTTVLCASLRWVHFERDFVQFIRGN